MIARQCNVMVPLRVTAKTLSVRIAEDRTGRTDSIAVVPKGNNVRC